MSDRVEVALPLPIHRTFTYRLTGGPRPEVGSRVLVPFRRSEMVGYVVGPGEEGPIEGLRSVLAVLDREPSVTPDVMELCRWMAAYYLAPLGLAIRTALPAVLSDASRDMLTADVPAEGMPPDLRPRERRLLEALAARGEPRRAATVRKELGMGSIWREVRSLEARGLLRHEVVPPAGPAVRTRKVVRLVRELGTLQLQEEVFGRARRQRELYTFLAEAGGAHDLADLHRHHGYARSVVQGLVDKGLAVVEDEERMRDPFAETPAPPPQDLTPTAAQRRAIDHALGALEGDGGRPLLLYGVTGSGKTLVYIELLRAALDAGRNAIVLVPEIALTPQTVARFRAEFGDAVAVLHSRLSDGERYDAWRLLRSGERRIAVGARSALFAPLPRLGVIVVDEEHEGSYKQTETPRYHARDLAVVRARNTGAVCVLGSATPSLESWRNAQRGKFTLVELPERVGRARLPEVRVVDLRRARKRDGGAGDRGRGVLSRELLQAMDGCLQRGEQVILLLNRRGYSSFVRCRSCGEVDQCPNCSISLTYHRAGGRLVCHHCRHEEPAPSRCSHCGSDDLSFRGLGTEQVERITVEAFPGARVARMDVDTTSGKWAHQNILDRVERREIDILLGTQMIAKGLDFPNVTLVGVVDADVGIHLPDFRASERTFQLLSQVAGRAGRGALGGTVIVQTALPEHYAIRAAVEHDYEAFAARELEERRAPAYPPWVRLMNVVVSSPDQRLAADAAEAAAAWARRHIRQLGEPAVELVGPAPCPIERLHRRWRWHFFLRSSAPAALSTVGRLLATGFRLPAGDVRLVLDRDPVALL